MTKKSQGLSLADIGALSEDVPVRDSFITVRGLSAEDVLGLLQKHPELLGRVLASRKDGEGIKVADLIGAAPEVIAAVIAKAVGEGTKEDEAAARRIPIETQMDILEAIGGLTFSNGFGPFVDRIMALARVASSVSSGRVSVTKSPQESST